MYYKLGFYYVQCKTMYTSASEDLSGTYSVDSVIFDGKKARYAMVFKTTDTLRNLTRPIISQLGPSSTGGVHRATDLTLYHGCSLETGTSMQL